MSDSSRRIRSYVIRAARMSDAQKKAYASFTPQWVIPYSGKPIDWDEYFPDAQKRIVEIGFGMGGATSQVASEHSDWGILGIDVHKAGVGKLLWHIDHMQLKNLFVVEHDAVDVLSKMILPGSLDGIHIWFPDPWPKKKHHKRRLIQPEFTNLLRDTLKAGGYIHAATDWEHYAEQILDIFGHTAGLRNTNKIWSDKPDYRPDTKFENKGIAAQRVIRDIIFMKETI
ncbi:MAG: tRNA (guanosine(46)-N7)-methyltransferase TrmB [Spirochaetaceae bacterium]|nr:tRNA (guanosine(46)-N7)-methyltransferase TrmB [Spirochaetaceae bacterium]